MVRIRSTGIELTLVSSTFLTCAVEFVNFHRRQRITGEMRSAAVCMSLICLLTLQFVFVHGGAISSDPDDFRRMTSIHRKKCIAETKTTLEAIEGTEYGEFPEDENLKCYFKCVLEKFNMIDKNGKIRYNILKQVIPDVYKEIGNEMIDSCKDVDAEDKCEKSFMFMKCMYNVNPIAFIAP